MMNARMTWTCFLPFLLFMQVSTAAAQDSANDAYEARIRMNRETKDRELKSRKTSPLQKKDRRRFNGLNYFPVALSWVKEVEFELIDGGDTLQIPTSSGRNKEFVRYGRYILRHNEQVDTLFGYVRVWPTDYDYEGEPYVFLPFKDASNGNETYGGGRYLDLPVPTESGKVEIDFNRCYNPYCAYGSGFSCPIPPEENHLDFSVDAGEKDYGSH